jgi:hypothetical protein
MDELSLKDTTIAMECQECERITIRYLIFMRIAYEKSFTM